MSQAWPSVTKLGVFPPPPGSGLFGLQRNWPQNLIYIARASSSSSHTRHMYLDVLLQLIAQVVRGHVPLVLVPVARLLQ